MARVPIYEWINPIFLCMRRLFRENNLWFSLGSMVFVVSWLFTMDLATCFYLAHDFTTLYLIVHGFLPMESSFAPCIESFPHLEKGEVFSFVPSLRLGIEHHSFGASLGYILWMSNG